MFCDWESNYRSKVTPGIYMAMVYAVYMAMFAYSAMVKFRTLVTALHTEVNICIQQNSAFSEAADIIYTSLFTITGSK